MAKAHIQEYLDLAEDVKGHVVSVGAEPAKVSQVVTYTTATQSSVFDTSTRFIRIVADADAYVAFGDNPTATANSMFIPADSAEYFGVKSGKVSVYDGVS